MKTTKCCGRCFYAGQSFTVPNIPEIGRLVLCKHPQVSISGTFMDRAKYYWSCKPCFWPRNNMIGRVQNSNTSWRPDVPIWVLRIGGLFFRLAWKTLSNRILFQAIALKNADKRMTLLQRWHMFVLENYAYWDQYDELSAEDRKETTK